MVEVGVEEGILDFHKGFDTDSLHKGFLHRGFLHKDYLHKGYLHKDFHILGYRKDWGEEGEVAVVVYMIKKLRVEH